VASVALGSTVRVLFKPSHDSRLKTSIMLRSDDRVLMESKIGMMIVIQLGAKKFISFLGRSGVSSR
jgi:hypothetical protein